ncbi:unnamed protein product [Lupinus luteus]|uniref:Uncharacterized protein n=1 Tax=Lupinus luteus TaxID=3873 RepID=A0AAV1WTR5_LUPLU
MYIANLIVTNHEALNFPGCRLNRNREKIEPDRHVSRFSILDSNYILSYCYSNFVIIILHFYLFLRYDSEGKEAAMSSIGAGSSPATTYGNRSVYSDCVLLSHITSNPSLGDVKIFVVEYYIF